MIEQAFAGRGELDAAPAAFEKRDAERLLEALDPRAGGGERKMRAVGAARDAARIGNGNEQLQVDQIEPVRAGEVDPPCRSCGGILKSATISFGQGLVQADLERAGAAARRCDLMLAVGTKLSVYPIAGIVPVAKEAGARVVILNAEPTEMDSLADIILRGSISALLPRLMQF